MLKKYRDPKFITAIITMAVIALNRKFLWHLDETQLAASVALSVNFIVVQLAEDFQKLKRGIMPSFNSTKLVTLVIACGLIGFSHYAGFDLDDESIIALAGTAGLYITGKGLKDISNAKKQAQEAKNSGLAAATEHSEDA